MDPPAGAAQGYIWSIRIESKRRRSVSDRRRLCLRVESQLTCLFLPMLVQHFAIKDAGIGIETGD